MPKPKAQRNFTDPESKIMKTSDGSFHQCFNAQTVVNAEHQIIVATDVYDCVADVANLIPMAEQMIVDTGEAPTQTLTDAGYCSADNLDHAAELTESTGTEFFIATGRQKLNRSGAHQSLARNHRVTSAQFSSVIDSRLSSQGLMRCFPPGKNRTVLSSEIATAGKGWEMSQRNALLK